MRQPAADLLVNKPPASTLDRQLQPLEAGGCVKTKIADLPSAISRLHRKLQSRFCDLQIAKPESPAAEQGFATESDYLFLFFMMLRFPLRGGVIWSLACRGKASVLKRDLLMSNLALKLKAAAFAFLVLSGIAEAADLKKPSGEVILTVTGKIANTNAPGKAEFDRAMLEELGISEIKTSHSWGEGVAAFEGVTAAKLLDVVGASGTQIKAAAINDYAIDLEIAELRKYPVLLALRQNGSDLRRRDRGPIWVVYPRDAHPELKDEKHNFKWIWQLKSLDIR